jgi:hypothetical protein
MRSRPDEREAVAKVQVAYTRPRVYISAERLDKID